MYVQLTTNFQTFSELASKIRERRYEIGFVCLLVLGATIAISYLFGKLYGATETALWPNEAIIILLLGLLVITLFVILATGHPFNQDKLTSRYFLQRIMGHGRGMGFRVSDEDGKTLELLSEKDYRTLCNSGLFGELDDFTGESKLEKYGKAGNWRARIVLTVWQKQNGHPGELLGIVEDYVFGHPGGKLTRIQPVGGMPSPVPRVVVAIQLGEIVSEQLQGPMSELEMLLAELPSSEPGNLFASEPPEPVGILKEILSVLDGLFQLKVLSGYSGSLVIENVERGKGVTYELSPGRLQKMADGVGSAQS